MPAVPSAESIDPGEPDEALGRLEMEVLARQALRRLPDHLRETVSLFYIEGYDSNAAAPFLEPWATAQSGHVIEYDRLPGMPEMQN